MTYDRRPTVSGGIDHVHVYAPSREGAAEWYRDVFGFETVESLAFWAEDPQGPLTIADPEGRIHLAIFTRTEPKPVSLAFRVTGTEYIAWRLYFRERGLRSRERNHDKSWSIYVVDPFENEIEVTTYDYSEVTVATEAAPG